MREKGIRFYVKGGPTLGSEELGARKEPDESYNLQTKKAIPDLAIEVIFTQYDAVTEFIKALQE